MQVNKLKFPIFSNHFLVYPLVNYPGWWHKKKKKGFKLVPFGLPRPLDLVDPLGRPRPRLTGASSPSVVSGFLAAIFSIFKYFLKKNLLLLLLMMPSKRS